MRVLAATIVAALAATTGGAVAHSARMTEQGIISADNLGEFRVSSFEFRVGTVFGHCLCSFEFRVSDFSVQDSPERADKTMPTTH